MYTLSNHIAKFLSASVSAQRHKDLRLNNIKYLFHCSSHFVASSHHAGDVVAGMVPERLTTDPSVAVVAIKRMLHDSIIPLQGVLQLSQLVRAYQGSV